MTTREQVIRLIDLRRSGLTLEKLVEIKTDILDDDGTVQHTVVGLEWRAIETVSAPLFSDAVAPSVFAASELIRLSDAKRVAPTPPPKA